jgi:catechol 2,3-dioxygenase-like lactoylglutathione lyase family enzyme
MSTTATHTATTNQMDTGHVDLKLEAIVVPVADVDRAKAFYNHLGWRLDADFAFDNGFRVVQFTPPGSPASIQFGTNITTAKPGSSQGIYLVVADVQQAHDALAALDVDVDNVFHAEVPGAQFLADEGNGRVDGAATDRASYGSFSSFRDPDGNGYLLQEITTRLPGRIDSGTTSFASPSDLMQALLRAATAHGEHEKRTGEYDEQWPVWYASYMVAEQSGDELPV